MSAPLVSVIVPVYRVQPVVAECLDALSRQTLQSLEVVLVDDGSPDGSADVCRRYMEANPRFRFIGQNNQGVSMARNAGLAVAAGRYVAFIDADDVPAVDMLDRMATAAIRLNADIVECGVGILGRKPRAQFVVEKERVLSSPEWGERRRKFVVNGTGTPFVWNKLYRRALLEAPELRFRLFAGEDYLFNVQAFARAKRYVELSTRLYSYRIQPGSLSRSFDPRFFSSLLEVMRVKQESMRALGFVAPSDWRAARTWFLTSLLAHAGSLAEAKTLSLTERRAIMRSMLGHPEVRAARLRPEWGGVQPTLVRLGSPDLCLAAAQLRGMGRRTLARVRGLLGEAA